MSQIPENFIEAIATEKGVSEAELDALLRALAGQTAEESHEELRITTFAVRKRLGAVYEKFGIEGRVLGKLEKLRALLQEAYQASKDKRVKVIVDLEEAPDVPEKLHGRDKVIETLTQWIVKEQCRLVAISGMGGIGKTALSVKLAENFRPLSVKLAENFKEEKNRFEYIIWLTLRNAPSLEDILEKLENFLNDSQDKSPNELEKSSSTLTTRIKKLMKFLDEHRCLIILDNVETILRSGTFAGDYRKDYEKYGELFRKVGEEIHNSCLVLTSREQPKDIELLEQRELPVKTMILKGLESEEAQKVFSDFLKDNNGDKENIKKIVEDYSGNPLILKLIASYIKTVLGGNTDEFIESTQSLTEEGIFIDDKIRLMLTSMVERLSGFEKEVMYWLAINRDWVSLSKLREYLVLPLPKSKLLEALQSLKDRSLIEGNQQGFTLQPVVMEYMTERLVDQVYNELLATTQELSSETNKKFRLINRYALIDTKAKDYIIKAQISLIIQPLIDKLLTSYDDKKKLKEKLDQEVISKLRENPLESGFAGGNILNILAQLKVDLTGLDCSELEIRQAYLQDVDLRDVNFTNSDLSQSVFKKTMSSILSVAFSPNGDYVATGDDAGKIRLWQVADGKEVKAFSEPTNWVRSVAFSLDGKYLASGSDDSKVRLWNVESLKNKEIEKLESKSLYSLTHDSDENPDEQKEKKFANWVCSVAFDQDSKILASGSQNGTIKLWNVETGKKIRTLLLPEQDNKQIWSIAFSHDGQFLASGNDNSIVNLWTVKTGKFIGYIELEKTKVEVEVEVEKPTEPIYSIAFRPPEKNTTQSSQDDLKSFDFQLAIGSDDTTVRLWNLTIKKNEKNEFEICKEKTVESKLIPVRSSVRVVAFSSDRNYLAIGSDDSMIRLWKFTADPDNKSFNWEIDKELRGHTNRIWAVAFPPDETAQESQSQQYLLASGSDDKSLKIWNISKSECLRTLKGYTNRIWAVAFSPNGNILASGNDDHTVRLWNIHDQEEEKILPGHTNRVWSVAFSPDSKILASASDDNSVRLWNVENLNVENLNVENKNKKIPLQNKKIPLLGVLKEITDCVWSVAFSPDGKYLALGSEDHTVKLWDVEKGEWGPSLQKKHSGRVYSVAFSPDKGQQYLLASGSDDHTINLWKAKTGEWIQTLEDKSSSSRIWSVTFSNDGKILASGHDDGTVKLWKEENQTWKYFKTIPAHTNRVWSVAFDKSDTILASGGDDGTVMLWDVKEENGHDSDEIDETSKCRVSFSISNETILRASGDDDGSIKLWKKENQKWIPLKTIQADKNSVYSIAFSHDGKILASGHAKGSVKFWDVEKGVKFNPDKVHENWVCSVAFDNVDKNDEKDKSTILASGSQDGTIKLWDVKPDGKTLRKHSLRIKRPYEGMKIIGVKGLSEPQKRDLITLGATETIAIQNEN
jgi:WD40 repeat protein